MRQRWRLLVVLSAVALVAALYLRGGLGASAEAWREAEAGPGAALLIVLVMAVTLACGISASHFLLLAPLLFAPHWSAAVVTAGATLGAACGYAVARFAGGAWVEKYRDGRLLRFLATHSSWFSLFGLRITPFCPHSFVNYAAGLARIPPARFLLATAAAMLIKAYVYALAVRQTVGAVAGTEALGASTALSLFAVAALAFVGHLLHRRLFGTEKAPGVVVNQIG